MSTYKHKEAFCLMWYACKDCGHRERIWNSRDGVTPFGILCRSCGKFANHVEWQRDECRPDYKPIKGQHIFRDGTPEEAEKFMRARIEKAKGTAHEPSPEYAALLVATVRNPDDPRNSEFQRGWPMLDVAP